MEETTILNYKNQLLFKGYMINLNNRYFKTLILLILLNILNQNNFDTNLSIIMKFNYHKNINNL